MSFTAKSSGEAGALASALAGGAGVGAFTLFFSFGPAANAAVVSAIAATEPNSARVQMVFMILILREWVWVLPVYRLRRAPLRSATIAILYLLSFTSPLSSPTGNTISGSNPRFPTPGGRR